MNKNSNDAFQKELVVKLAAEIGAKTALETFNKERLKEENRRSDQRYQNTKLLLENYRDLKAYSKNAVYSAYHSEDVIKVLDLMWDPHNKIEVTIESIKKSAVKTQIIMAHINSMLKVYEDISNTSPNPTEIRKYNILIDRYIGDDIITIEKIADKYSIDVRTAFRDLSEAITRMGKLLFGIDMMK